MKEINAHSDKRKIKAPNDSQGGKMSQREVKWKTPTNWKSGTEVE